MLHGPRDLPELRQQLYGHSEMGRFFHEHYRVTSESGLIRGEDGPESSSQTYVGNAGKTLATSDLHYVDGAFARLVSAAAPSLPGTPIAEHDLPAERGLVAFAEPWFDGQTSRNADWIAMWCLTSDSSTRRPNAGLLVWFMVDRYTKWLRCRKYPGGFNATWAAMSEDEAMRAMPAYCPVSFALYTFGSRLDDTVGYGEVGAPLWMLRYLLTTWHIMRQRLTQTRVVRPNRASARRIARAGGNLEQNVRVISLRLPDSSNPSTETGPREYQHQWIVRGHWRQHWYPSIQDHRPVWIAPHIKGPEGAPLIGGEKVYAWTR